MVSPRGEQAGHAFVRAASDGSPASHWSRERERAVLLLRDGDRARSASDEVAIHSGRRSWLRYPSADAEECCAASFPPGQSRLRPTIAEASAWRYCPEGRIDEEDEDGEHERSTARSSSSSSSLTFSSQDDDSSDSVAGRPLCGGGLRACSPELHRWLKARAGGRRNSVVILAFMIFNALRFLMWENIPVDRVNPNSILVVANATSLVLALVAALSLEGRQGLEGLCGQPVSCWFLIVAAMFTFSSYLIFCAYRTGLKPVVAIMVGYIYMPIAAGFSYAVLKRRYGKLEWLALSIMVLGAAAFVLLRQRCEEAKCHMMQFEGSDQNSIGTALVAASTVTSSVASLLSERLYLDRVAVRAGPPHAHFFAIKVGLDMSCLFFSFCVWALSATSLGKFVVGADLFLGKETENAEPTGWFGEWRQQHFVSVFTIICQSWLAGYVSMRFSTVVKALVQTLSTLLVICVSDPVLHRFSFETRWVPSVSIAIIAVLSAVVFQTGRINFKTMRKKLRLSAACDPVPEAPAGAQVGAATPAPAEVAKPEAPADDGRGAALLQICSGALQQSSIVLLVLGDGGRQVMQSAALSESMMTPQIFVILTNICGLALATVLTVLSDGWEGLRSALNFGKILRFMSCGFFFAVTASLISVAYARGISAALANVLGKIYTPLVALGSRWVLGKYYMWLEWVALVILTLASVAFGYVQQMEQRSTGNSDIVAVLCVLGSATAACVNSLLMEKLMQEEDEPFHVQKVRLDAGTLVWSVLFLPVMGAIATRPKYKFWKERPLSPECDWSGECSDGVYTAREDSPAGCQCGGGVGDLLVGCNAPEIYLALALFVFYSWITGVVVKRFSSIHRSVADGFSLLLLYFVLDPLVRGRDWNNWALDLLALIVPAAIVTFSSAASEMGKVLELADAQGEVGAAPGGDQPR